MARLILPVLFVVVVVVSGTGVRPVVAIGVGIVPVVGHRSRGGGRDGKRGNGAGTVTGLIGIDTISVLGRTMSSS